MRISNRQNRLLLYFLQYVPGLAAYRSFKSGEYMLRCMDLVQPAAPTRVAAIISNSDWATNLAASVPSTGLPEGPSPCISDCAHRTLAHARVAPASIA